MHHDVVEQPAGASHPVQDLPRSGQLEVVQESVPVLVGRRRGQHGGDALAFHEDAAQELGEAVADHPVQSGPPLRRPVAVGGHQVGGGLGHVPLVSDEVSLHVDHRADAGEALGRRLGVQGGLLGYFEIALAMAAVHGQQGGGSAESAGPVPAHALPHALGRVLPLGQHLGPGPVRRLAQRRRDVFVGVAPLQHHRWDRRPSVIEHENSASWQLCYIKLCFSLRPGARYLRFTARHQAKWRDRDDGSADGALACRFHY